MSMLNNIPSFPKKHCLKGIKNWIFFKLYLISAVWNKGLCHDMAKTAKSLFIFFFFFFSFN